MVVPPLRDLLPRVASIEPRDAQSSQSSEVPMWAFIVMTVFSLFLMGFVCVLLWRPDLFRGLGASSAQGAPDDEKLGYGHGREQCQQCSGDSGTRKPWFRSGGSFRSNINRWRNGVDSRGEGPPPNAPTEVLDDDPASHNYAPAPARPVSYMQRIPEGYEQYEQYAQYGNIKTASVAEQRI